MLEGRSSLGRLGLNIHVTAGIDICQIYYHTIEGEYDLYRKNYFENNGLEASKMYLEF